VAGAHHLRRIAVNTEHCQEAIDTLLPALNYGVPPLAAVPNAENIHKQAALALGKLKAENRQPRVAEHVAHL
jgi:hypothetical protein